MQRRNHKLADDRTLVVREATVDDAELLLEYIEAMSGETDYLSFGPGEFELNESQERGVLLQYLGTDNKLYVVGLINDEIVSSLSFSAGSRSRVRHTGEFGMSVRREYWGVGIGSLMLDTLIEWARETKIVFKINLRVRTDNHRAIHLYERKGFVREGTLSRETFIDGQYYDHHCMGLEL